MQKDLWHFPRTELAKKVIDMFHIGLSSALTFFAPRRMGKTEFLRKDILPLATKGKWAVHYFSFLDVHSNAQELYLNSLLKFALETKAIKDNSGIINRLHKITGQAGAFKAEFELNKKDCPNFNMQVVIDSLASRRKTILLLDEVQVLAINSSNDRFLASMRTALDIVSPSHCWRFGLIIKFIKSFCGYFDLIKDKQIKHIF